MKANLQTRRAEINNLYGD